MDSTSATKNFHDVGRGGIQGRRGTQLFSVSQLFVGDIHGGDDGPKPAANLHSEVSQTANAKDRQTLARLNIRAFQSAVDCDTRAEQRSGFHEGKFVGNS